MESNVIRNRSKSTKWNLVNAEYTAVKKYALCAVSTVSHCDIKFIGCFFQNKKRIYQTGIVYMMNTCRMYICFNLFYIFFVVWRNFFRLFLVSHIFVYEQLYFYLPVIKLRFLCNLRTEFVHEWSYHFVYVSHSSWWIWICMQTVHDWTVAETIFSICGLTRTTWNYCKIL